MQICLPTTKIFMSFEKVICSFPDATNLLSKITLWKNGIFGLGIFRVQKYFDIIYLSKYLAESETIAFEVQNLIKLRSSLVG